ncbi:S1/P1 nuclease [Aliikangiella coralliicola]|nr:S1/P1 nuclease [Aliikangiella coralliicola]
MQLIFAKVTLISLLLLFSNGTHALSQNGHRIVCDMAFQLLSKNTQKKVKELVDLMPKWDREKLNDYQKVGASSKVKFSNACVWPDSIKNNNPWNKVKIWHYINVQRDESEVQLDDCLVGCLITGINLHSKVIKSESDKLSKAYALYFLGHWYGDIHQPLHVSFADDIGGGDTKIRNFSGCSNLHSVWDGCIIKETNLSESKLAKSLLKSIANMKDNADLKSTLDEWKSSSVKDMANESLQIAIKENTEYCKLSSSGKCEKIPNDPGRPSRALPDDYFENNWPILSVRLKQAAVRLAARIEDTLN